MSPSANRRQVVSFLLVPPAIAFGSQANSALAVGIVGCGSRGAYIGAFFQEFAGARVVALADPVPSQIAAIRDKLQIPDARGYATLDGYRQLCESQLDAVVIESPPYFHPAQARAAVEAGKHVFCAKPVAVDVAGCWEFSQAAQGAGGRLSFLVDFQTRARAVFQEAAARVRRGDIGEPVLGHVYYHGGRNRVPDTSGLPRQLARLRNWLHDRVLSGDIIVEQNIHVLDVANWFLQAHPERAWGAGGRKARLDGDVWDHFIVTYWYAGGVKVDFSSAQFLNGYSDLCIRIYGTEGVVDSHYNGLVRITGEHPWLGAEKDSTFRDGAIENVRAFARAVRSGHPVNNAQDAVISNLTAILGRTAAYAQREVSWREMMESAEKWQI
jgi:predicted dehydrogenase